MKRKRPKKVVEGDDDRSAPGSWSGSQQLWAYHEEAGSIYEYPQEDPTSDVSAAVAKMRDSLEKLKCPNLWEKGGTPDRPLSGTILKPIRAALRRKGWNKIVAMPGSELTDDSMARLFGEGLEKIERELGRLLLDAVLMGNREFVAYVDDAIKDSDALFHRGTVRENFFRWWHDLPDTIRLGMTRGEVVKGFEEKYRTLNKKEWADLKREFALENVPRGRPGPKPK